MPRSPASAALTEPLPFRQLAALTVELARATGFGHVRVFPLEPGLGHLDGRCSPRQRVVWYPTTSPLHAVAHEVAHLLHPAEDHGPVWLAEFGHLCRVLVTAR